MRDRDMDDLARWMAAEQEESFDEADALFATLASRHLQVTEAPAGLSATIMAAIPHRVADARPRLPFCRDLAMRDLVGSWWVRATTATAVVVLGVALAAVSTSQLFDVALRSVDALARLTHGAFTSLSAALGVWGVSWTLLASLGRAAIVVATSGAAPALIGASLLLASVAVVGLTRLLSPREECC